MRESIGIKVAASPALPNYSGARRPWVWLRANKRLELKRATGAKHADPSATIYATTDARYAGAFALPTESDDSSTSKVKTLAVCHPMDAIYGDLWA
jgi:hypothetical protein